jgi:hypothetical protein
MGKGIGDYAPLIIAGICVLGALYFLTAGAQTSPVSVGSTVVPPSTADLQAQTAVATANASTAQAYQSGLFQAFGTLASAGASINNSNDQLELGKANIQGQVQQATLAEQLGISQSNNALAAANYQANAQLQAVQSTNRAQTTNSFWSDLTGGITAALPFLAAL